MEKLLSCFYTTKPDDTLDTISQKYKTSPITILVYNRIDPLRIKKGERIYIPTPSFW